VALAGRKVGQVVMALVCHTCARDASMLLTRSRRDPMVSDCDRYSLGRRDRKGDRNDHLPCLTRGTEVLTRGMLVD
jgi:hypothetical protein